MASVTWDNMRMSPSKIGALCNPDCCLRCFWTLLRMKFRKPFNFPMPGILHSLDAQEKQVARVLLDRDGVLPEYFGAFCDATEILPINEVSGFHEETQLELYGKPDLVLRDKAGLVSVVDNKTAQVKPPEHALSAMYKAQINFYGYLLERAEESYVISRVGLLYYSIAELTDDQVAKKTGKDFMWALLRPTMIEIEYSPETIIEPLFRQVRELIDSKEAPEGREGCKDCLLLEAFQDCLSVTDSSCVRYMDAREKEKHFYSERHREFSELDTVRQMELDSLPALAAMERPWGVLAQWM